VRAAYFSQVGSGVNLKIHLFLSKKFDDSYDRSLGRFEERASYIHIRIWEPLNPSYLRSIGNKFDLKIWLDKASTFTRNSKKSCIQLHIFKLPNYQPDLCLKLRPVSTISKAVPDIFIGPIRVTDLRIIQMKKISLYLTLTATIASSNLAQADLFLGLHAGASLWQGDFGGQIGSDPQSADALGFDTENYNSYYFAVELLGLPEMRLAQTNINTVANGTLNSSFDLGGVSYPIATDLTTDFDLQATDLTLYWQLLDTVVGLDLGLTGRYMDGSVAVTDGVTDDRVDYEVVIPLGFIRARLNLPFSGWYLEGDTHAIGYDGDRFSDSAIKIGWQTQSLADIGLNVGYRQMSVKVADLDGFDADLDISGPFASATFHF